MAPANRGELSCLYGCSGPKFKKTAALGIYGPPVILTDQQADEFVAKYRRSHDKICGKMGLWKQAERMIATIGRGEQAEWGPLTIRDKRIWLPNGACIIYDTLVYDQIDGWTYKTRKGVNRLWGSKLCQHVCEALGRLILGQAALRLLKRGYRMILTVHDEGVFVIEDDTEAGIILEEFTREVAWAPGLPIGAEVTIGEKYEK